MLTNIVMYSKIIKNFFIDLFYGEIGDEIPDNAKNFDAAFVEA